MNWKNEGVRFGKFLVVGGFGFVVDFGTFNLLSTGAGLDPAIAQTISFCAAIVSNFFWNRYWIYPDSRAKHVGHQAILFVAINLIGYIIRTPLFLGLTPVWVAILPPLPIPALQAAHNLALACAVLVVMIWNFVVNRFWTYNDVQ
jgi:putative flippase GtrA